MINRQPQCGQNPGGQPGHGKTRCAVSADGAPRAGARGNTTRGYDERGGLQMWPEGLAAGGPRTPPLGARANLGWLLSCRLALATSPYPHIAFPRAPTYANIYGTYVGIYGGA